MTTDRKQQLELALTHTSGSYWAVNADAILPALLLHGRASSDALGLAGATGRTTDFINLGLPGKVFASSEEAAGAAAGEAVVALVPLVGVMWSRAPEWYEAYGLTSPQRAASRLSAAAADASVSGIVLMIDSPGGTVAGTEMLAMAVRSAAQSKPVIAFGAGMVCSAAYMVAAQATSLVVEPSTVVGSIGAMVPRVDVTEMMGEWGISVKHYRYGQNKARNQMGEPIDEQVDDLTQTMIDSLGRLMVGMAATGRAAVTGEVLTADEFSEKGGFGKVFTGEEALALGLVDALGSENDLGAFVASALDYTEETSGQEASASKGNSMTQPKDDLSEALVVADANLAPPLDGDTTLASALPTPAATLDTDKKSDETMKADAIKGHAIKADAMKKLEPLVASGSMRPYEAEALAEAAETTGSMAVVDAFAAAPERGRAIPSAPSLLRDRADDGKRHDPVGKWLAERNKL